MSDQLSKGSKFLAGLLLIVFTGLVAFFLIGLWPDRLPPPNSKSDMYSFSLFKVRFLDSATNSPQPVKANSNTAPAKPTTTTDTARTTTTTDTTKPATATTATKPADTTTKIAPSGHVVDETYTEGRTINLDTLILILVAIAGFLGNMIHIATSFTTFVGSNKYDGNWLLWYFVRPFTAAALALALYFSFRAGFMSYSSSGGNLNLYGVMTIAILTGLFTDMATLKLKEIFEVIFKPKDGRPDKLSELKITAVTPSALTKGVLNNILISGQSLTAKKLVITIGDDVIAGANTSDTVISFGYTIKPADEGKPELPLSITDADGKSVYTGKFTIA